LSGDYAVGSDASLLITSKRPGGATPDLARLAGRRLVTVNETEQHSQLNEQRVKFITGHDVITARNLFEDPFDFTPSHKTFLTTNYKPIVKGTDDGIWRRIHLLPFTTIIAKGDRDPSYREKKLLPELPGILNWALEGLRAYWSEGLNPPPEVTEATDEYREEMDIIGSWIDDRCQLDPNAEETTALLHMDYEQWAKRQIGFAMRCPRDRVYALSTHQVAPAVIDDLIGADRIGRCGDMPVTEAAILAYLMGQPAPQPRLTLVQSDHEPSSDGANEKPE
jgi:putative DNA primase/helicase